MRRFLISVLALVLLASTILVAQTSYQFGNVTIANLTVTGTCTGCGGGGSTAFSGITSGTNTAAAMVVGSGASITESGTGTINANELNGTAAPFTQQFTITSAQLLAGSPVTLVAAPGTGKYWNITDVAMQYKFNTTPYASNGSLQVGADTSNTVVATQDVNGFMDQTSDQLGFPIAPSQSFTNTARADMENQPIVLSFPSGALTDGNGSLIITVTYQAVTLQ
jgi:hypothetical protein